MPKIHITSFLRPRGRYKCIEDYQQQKQQQQQNQEQQQLSHNQQTQLLADTADATTSTCHESQTQQLLEEQQLQQQTTNNKVQLIPTLEFVVKPPDKQDVATKTTTSKTTTPKSVPNTNESSSSNNNDDVGDISHSRCTFLIATQATATRTTTSDSSSSVDNYNYNFYKNAVANNNSDDDDDFALQQEVADLCRCLNDDDSTFVDEPTSSISIEMDSHNRTTPTTTTQTTSSSREGGRTSTITTTTSATSVTPSSAAAAGETSAATTTSASRSALTAQTTPSSDQSIEEEIEEAIELSEELEDEQEAIKATDDSYAESAQFSEAAGYEAVRERQVIGSEKSSQSQSRSRLDRSLDAQFEIDDDQLSGGKLAQHFVLDDDDEEEEEEAEDDDDDFDISLPMDKSVEHSQHTRSLSVKDHHHGAGGKKLQHSRHASSEEGKVEFFPSSQSKQPHVSSLHSKHDDSDDDDNLGGINLTPPKRPPIAGLHSKHDDSDDDEVLGGINLTPPKRPPIAGLHSKHEDSDDDEDLGGINLTPPKRPPISGVHSRHDDTDSGDLSLSLEKPPKEHSKPKSHEQELMKAVELQPESLTNQSTADDVSDFIDDVRQDDDELLAASLSNDLELPLPEDVSKEIKRSSENLPQSKEKSVVESEKTDKKLIICSGTPTKQSVSKAPQINPTLPALLGASPEYSEKDHSMEEIIESNQSIEMTLDDKDLSSLAASFDLHNESLINKLLADTPQQTQTEKSSKAAAEQLKIESFNETFKRTAQITDHKSLKGLETLELKPTQMREEQKSPKSLEEKMEQEKSLPSQHPALKTTEVMLTYAKSTKLVENLAPVSSVQIPEAKEAIKNTQLMTENRIKLPSIGPKSLTQTDSYPEFDTIELEETTTRPDLSDINIADLTSSSLFAALNKQYVAAKRGHTTSPELARLEEDAEEDDDENALELMKLRILAMKQEQQQHNLLSSSETVTATGVNTDAPHATYSVSTVKQMERVPLGEFSKDILEDITEESERNSLSTADDQQTLSNKTTTNDSETSGRTLQVPDVDASTLQVLEQKVSELQQLLAGKDACLASLNQQLETATQRSRESNGASCEQPMSSGRESSSLITNSTEYRTFQEDFTGGPTTDFYLELSKRDELIVKLTDSLQQSLNVRESLQTESEKLSNEVQLLRKQLTEAMDTLRRPTWPRDQESSGGQRISEISMDLISESDDEELERFLTDNEDRISRSSRERQFSLPRQGDIGTTDRDQDDTPVQVFSKQIEQFQKYLTPNEVRIFFMVQKKFDDFLCQELEKSKMKHDHELKTLLEQLECEKQEKIEEIKRLLQQRTEKDEFHSKEMEDLRKYFEHKCADMEKQFSDDIFSQKSQQQGADTSSEGSDLEQMPEEIVAFSAVTRSKETSPRKRSRAELLLSPSHRQLTPSSDAKQDATNLSIEISELKSFYQSKIHEQQRLHDENLRKMSERLKYYETRYPEDDFMSTNKNTNISAATDASDSSHQSLTTQVRDPNTSLIIIDQDELNLNNESQVIQKIIEEYEKRLQEQLDLARADMVNELENQIQTLLSETTADDHHWPPELILLREKFTAKSQLEIAQLQIKHEDEMSRLKIEYEKQLNRKNKRHSAFDLARDLDHIIGERDDLRELAKTFRHVLAELAKCVVNYEDDLNATLVDEMQRVLANRSAAEITDVADLQQTFNNSLLNSTLNSTLLSHSKRFVPDVQALLEVIEDPNLKDFINKNCGDFDEFDLNDCLERLKAEAGYLLTLSEDLCKKHQRRSSESSGGEKNDSCCEAEDGLKISLQHPVHKFLRANSLNEQQLRNVWQMSKPQLLNSLPPDLNRLQLSGETPEDVYSTPGNASELNFQVQELKMRLVKSENDRAKLQHELENTITRNTELGQELQTLRDQVVQLDSLNRTEFAEGYGLANSIKSPIRHSVEKSSSSFAQLQERARNILSSPTQQQQQSHDATAVLLQMIEDFCREGDQVVEWSKKDREDLQAQIDAADKQLKATRQFLEEQAAEREQERDEFLREIERMKLMLRDKEKERSSFEHASKEVEQQESQIRELNQKLNECTAKRDKFEVELKASIDKIFVLREIISELETQVETKALNEHVMSEKITQLEAYINSQSHSNDTLQQEVQSLKAEIGESYQERIRQLEEKLQNVRPTAEQSMVMDQVIEQLRDIENTLDQKTKTLESLHNSSNSCSLSHTEDVSLHGMVKNSASLPVQTSANILPTSLGSPLHPSPRQHSLSMEGVQRIVDKLSKHTRVEEAAIKRIRDLDMQITSMRSSCVELQHERDSLQERMSDQMQRIAALQSRLEEQRQRAEELQRAGTSDLNRRIHDLQNEVQNLRETLSSRDKQIANLRQQLEKSKVAIDRLEADLAAAEQTDRNHVERLEQELQQRNSEVQKLKEKIKSEMVNRLALPDLMETMLADKNEEIDHLKEQLEAKERELVEMNVSPNSSAGARGGKEGKEEVSTKLSARTLSDILSISEFDEPDLIRRAAAAKQETPLTLGTDAGSYMQRTMDTSKEAVANLTHKRTEELAVFSQLHPANTFDNPHYFQDANVLLATGKSEDNSIIPALVPRQINFSSLTEDSKLKQSTFILATPEQAAVESQNNERLREQSEKIAELEQQLSEAQAALQRSKEEQQLLLSAKEQESKALEEDLVATQLRLGGLEENLSRKQAEIAELQQESQKLFETQKSLTAKSFEIEQLLQKITSLTAERNAKSEALTKQEKNLANYQQNEEKYLRRLAEQEEVAERRTCELTALQQKHQDLSATHAQCAEATQAVHSSYKDQLNALNSEIKVKDERLLMLSTKLSIAEDTTRQLQQQTSSMEQELEKLRNQQQQSDNSSRQLSVDEIAQQLEKELNYSAQLDSNILKAIESEEENNLDRSTVPKESLKTKEAATSVLEHQNGTDDENFTGERELLNQLEALRAQIQVEREQAAEMRQDLQAEKQHSQEIQEQDVIIIEAMRKRLETALAQEDELHKQLDQEREKCDRLQAQLTVLQRSDSRRNSALHKSPNESPRRSPRSSDFDVEQAERLRSEIKLLTSQQERERERCADMQHSLERERARFDTELQDRIAYSERLKQEMERLARDKELAEQEVEHLQERLLLQSQEIESLEARIATLQEAETRRTKRRDLQRQESAQNLAELQELKAKHERLEAERDALTQSVSLLRFDLERSAAREAKLAEALANANADACTINAESSIPQQFLQKMKDINVLLAENTKENRQMAETVQFLVEERRQLQKKCEGLEQQLGSNVNVSELEERCNHLLGRYLRVESHRKALVYQKRYLKISLQSYQESEARAMASMVAGGHILPPQQEKKRMFKTVALAIIAIQRMKYIGRIWHTGKRIVSKSVFTITQQKRSQPPTISCAAITSTSPTSSDQQTSSPPLPHTPTSPRFNLLEQRLAPLQTPALLCDLSNGNDCGRTMRWARQQAARQQHQHQP